MEVRNPRLGERAGLLKYRTSQVKLNERDNECKKTLNFTLFYFIQIHLSLSEFPPKKLRLRFFVHRATEH